MAVKLSPFGPKPHFEDSNGNPANGFFLYFYVAGSSTPQDTYTTSLGNVANSNPIELNSRGESTTQIWFTEGQSYKAELKTAAGVSVWTSDNLTGINDVTAVQDEWQASGLTPTYVSATSFTLSGDQTTAFHKRRRLKSTNTGGTIYSTIILSSYSAPTTTVTVVNDSGSLDSGLSAVSYGVEPADNPAIDPQMMYRKATAIAAAVTTNIWDTQGDYLHITGGTGITGFGTAAYAGNKKTLYFEGTGSLVHDGTRIQTPGGAPISFGTGDRADVRADTTALSVVTNFRRYAGNFSMESLQTFTAIGTATWTKPTGCRAVMVEVQAPGGGGGGADSDGVGEGGGGGGGAGGYSKKFITSGLGSTESVIVGILGTSGVASGGGSGGTGGTTSFGSHCSATGGGGGEGTGVAAASVDALGGTGGAGSNGNINSEGGDGASGVGAPTASAIGGNGGSSVFGSGGRGGAFVGTGVEAGLAGNDFGGGGGGGADANDTTGAAGGAGGRGIVIVWEYY